VKLETDTILIYSVAASATCRRAARLICPDRRERHQFTVEFADITVARDAIILRRLARLIAHVCRASPGFVAFSAHPPPAPSGHTHSFGAFCRADAAPVGFGLVWCGTVWYGSVHCRCRCGLVRFTTDASVV
jgi:hypothetical protein